MAKTSNPDIFVVTPRWVNSTMSNPRVWYMKMLNKNGQTEVLLRDGAMVDLFTSNRHVKIQAVDDVSPGSTHVVDGETVTVLDKDGSITEPHTNHNLEIHTEARAAGEMAAKECIPEPMVVFQHKNPLDDNSEVVKVYEPVMNGVCGFAWVNVRPGNCSFARWAKDKLGANKGYHGGVDIWVSAYGQSMERKESYARAYAEILRNHDIKAFSQSRMD